MAMKRALVQFIVQVPEEEASAAPGPVDGIIVAMNQAERYLNTGDRCVDFDIGWIPDERVDERDEDENRVMPLPAKYLAKDAG